MDTQVVNPFEVMVRVNLPGSTASNLKEPASSVVECALDAGVSVFEGDQSACDLGSVGVEHRAADASRGLVGWRLRLAMCGPGASGNLLAAMIFRGRLMAWRGAGMQLMLIGELSRV